MKILNKNGLPYSICVLFAPGVVILPIELELSDFFEFRFSLHKERTLGLNRVFKSWALTMRLTQTNAFLCSRTEMITSHAF